MNERWTPDADNALRNETLDGNVPLRMADSMGRTEGALRARLQKLGLSDKNGHLLVRSDMEWTISLDDRESVSRFSCFLQRFLPDTVSLVVESASRLTLRILEPQAPVIAEFREDPELPLQPMAFQILREWRKEKARELAVSPFIVAWNSHLEEIALRMPKTLQDLRLVRGVRASFVQKFGAEVLEVLSRLTADKAPTTRPREPISKPVEGEPSGIKEFMPSRANEVLVEALPPTGFEWGPRPKDPEMLDHWRSFAVLWMKLLEGEAEPGNEAERRVMEFQPVWEGCAKFAVEVPWEKALHEYAYRVAERRKLSLQDRVIFRDPRQEFFPDDKVGRLGPYSR